MIELILETNDLIFQLDNFLLTINKLGLFIFQIKSFCVYELIQVVDSGQLFRDIILQCSSLGRQISGFFGFEFILIVQLVNFFGILTVSLSEILKLVFQVFLLVHQL